MTTHEIDNLLKTRFGGVVNIRGIRFQILYSVLKSFDLYKEQNKTYTIQLEGIEDLDLRGFNFRDEYIQIKTSEKSWSWYQLKDPLSNYIEAYRLNPDSVFSLIVNFDLTSDIAKLANLKSLPAKDKKALEKKFQELCLKAGANKTEVETILEKININSLKEIEILSVLRQAVTENFNLASNAVEVYILVLIGKFLEWSKDRKIVGVNDLEFIKTEVGESLARESDFQAYGRGLINKVIWHSDANENDYFEGKRTRTSHIFSGLDVYRPVWMERIDKAINNSRICILRSSSGQGKSSLMFRYAYENWIAENTFSLQVAETMEQAEKVCNYLSFRSGLGLPILLLIDNADWKTKYWPVIAGKCAELGIYVIMTTRNEDWIRFSDETLTNFEILEPELDLEEAINIFNSFKQKQKIHSSLESPEWAYERIGEPHLLIEYVYLITHGEMLEERLKEQIKQISSQKEDPAKIEILRKSSLAHALGIPLVINKLMKEIQFKEDPQQVLKSINDEYVILENGNISGLHWVRSNHLVELLHDTYPEPTVTALSLINSIPPDYIPLYVSNALSRQDINKEEFLEGLIESTKKINLKDINKIIDGIYEAGERQFFQANKSIFDEAYELAGASGVFIFSFDFMPVIKSDYIDSVIESTKDDKRSDNLLLLKEQSAKAINIKRGLDFVTNFLKNIIPHLQLEQLKKDLENTGILLDWCFLCQVKIPLWETISEELVITEVFNLPVESFSWFAQGLYRYDENIYLKWYNSNKDDIYGYLKLNLDCIKLELTDNILSFEFIPGKDKELLEQAGSRLDNFRSALPFCDKYCSQGFYPHTRPSVDNTSKNILKEDLPFLSDTQKNKVWRETAIRHYIPDSYYIYQKNWYEFRIKFLDLAKEFSTYFQSLLTSKEFNFRDKNIIFKVSHSFKKVPNPPFQTPKAVTNIMKDAPESWKMYLQNFFTQFLNFIADQNKINDRRLSIHNLKDSVKLLTEVHAAFSELFKISPDYFDLESLKKEELKIYPVLAELYDTWANNPPKIKFHNILTYINSERDRKKKNLILRIKMALKYLQEEDINIIYPNEIYLDFPLKYLTFAFSVNNPLNYDQELLKVIDAIYNIKDTADFFYLIPFHNGSRFNKNGYRFSSNSINEIVEKDSLTFWETMLPVEVPESSLKTLPNIPLNFLPELEYPVKVLSLLMSFKFIIEQINFISCLKDKENRFEKELFLKHRENLVSQIKNLMNGVEEAKKKIPSNYLKEEQINVQWSLLEKLLENTLEITPKTDSKPDFHYQVIFDALVDNLHFETAS